MSPLSILGATRALKSEPVLEEEVPRSNQGDPRKVVSLSPEDYLKRCKWVSDLPEGIRGHAIADMTKNERYEVKGDVNIHPVGRSNYNTLIPAEIGGNLKIPDCLGIKSLDGLYVGGSVDASRSGITKTGPSFQCDGRFLAIGCKDLKSLDGHFKGDVAVWGSGLQETKPGFHCGRHLMLCNLGDSTCSDFHTLEGNVGGNVLADKSSIVRTGPLFNCGGSVFARDCKNLESLDGSISVGCDVSGSGLKKISPRFEVFGETKDGVGLNVSNCPKLNELNGHIPKGAKTDGELPLAEGARCGKSYYSGIVASEGAYTPTEPTLEGPSSQRPSGDAPSKSIAMRIHSAAQSFKAGFKEGFEGK